MAKKRLGKGMDALFFEASDDEQKETEVSTSDIRLSEIEPSRDQPRKTFDQQAILALADSIREHGVLQPILVRPIAGGYKIIAGERRWRAAKEAGLTEIPAIVKELGDAQAAQIALIENLQREDLNPIEEAQGYDRLMKAFDMTQEQVSQAVGKSRPAIANSLRLLKLDEKTAELVRNGELSTGHAKALLSVADSVKRYELAKEAVQNGYTVRQTERLAAAISEKPKPTGRIKFDDTYAMEIEAALVEHLGSGAVSVRPKKSGEYQLTVKLSDKEHLKRFAQMCIDYTDSKK